MTIVDLPESGGAEALNALPGEGGGHFRKKVLIQGNIRCIYHFSRIAKYLIIPHFPFCHIPDEFFTLLQLTPS